MPVISTKHLEKSPDEFNSWVNAKNIKPESKERYKRAYAEYNNITYKSGFNIPQPRAKPQQPEKKPSESTRPKFIREPSPGFEANYTIVIEVSARMHGERKTYPKAIPSSKPELTDYDLKRLKNYLKWHEFKDSDVRVDSIRILGCYDNFLHKKVDIHGEAYN